MSNSSDRLREARSAAGYRSAAEFADKNGFTEVTYRSHENGTRPLTMRAAKSYAPSLNVSPLWLMCLSDETEDAANAAAPRVPVRGLVGAGAEVFPFPDEDALRAVTAPPGCENGWAYEVRGNSMEPVYHDGDVIFPNPRPVPIESLFGKDCAVDVHDGPRLIKKVLRGTNAGYVRLFSYETNDLSDEVRIVDARPIIWVKRRS